MSGRDIGSSVRQRLLNQSRANGRPFQEMLQYFAMERFLRQLVVRSASQAAAPAEYRAATDTHKSQR